MLFFGVVVGFVVGIVVLVIIATVVVLAEVFVVSGILSGIGSSSRREQSGWSCLPSEERLLQRAERHRILVPKRAGTTGTADSSKVPQLLR